MSNGLGMFRYTAFIPLSTICSTPFVCYYHLCGTRSSLIDYPSVLCVATEAFTSFATVGCSLIIVDPVSFLSPCTHTMLVQPGRVSEVALLCWRSFGFHVRQFEVDTTHPGPGPLARCHMWRTVPVHLPDVLGTPTPTRTRTLRPSAAEAVRPALPLPVRSIRESEGPTQYPNQGSPHPHRGGPGPRACVYLRHFYPGVKPL